MSLDINSSSICIGDKINNEAKRFQKMNPLNGVEGYDFTLFDDASYCNYKTVDLGSFYVYDSYQNIPMRDRIWKKELMPQDLLTKLNSDTKYKLTELTCTGIFITLGNKTYLIPRFINSNGVVQVISINKKLIWESASMYDLGTPSLTKNESAYANSDLNIAKRTVSLYTKEYFSFNYNVTIPNMELMHYLAHNYNVFFNAGQLSLLPTNEKGLYNIAASVYSYGVEIAKADSVDVHDMTASYKTDTNTIYILPVIEL
jgi:uncharacterized protein YaaQ